MRDEIKEMPTLYEERVKYKERTNQRENQRQKERAYFEAFVARTQAKFDWKMVREGCRDIQDIGDEEEAKDVVHSPSASPRGLHDYDEIIL